MKGSQLAIGYGAVLVALLVLDGLWLGVLTKDLYRREMGPLMAESIRVWPAVIFYALYPAAVVYLALATDPGSLVAALCRGAVLGLAAYGAYNMTNLAIVKGWPLGLSFIDWAWGGVVTALVAAAGWAATWGRG